MSCEVNVNSTSQWESLYECSLCFKVIRKRGRKSEMDWRRFLRYIRVTKAEGRKKKDLTNKKKYSSSYILSSTYYPTSSTSYFIWKVSFVKVQALDPMYIAVRIYWSLWNRKRNKKKLNLRVKVNLPEPDAIALPSYWLIKSILYKIHANIIFKD